jgi:metallo-beta-lactamase family protein
MQLQFLGATGTVTGSKYAITTARDRILVDCGLYQGLKQLRLRNRRELPLDVSKLDAVVLTHAHIDHSGFLPALVRDGYRGPIYCTPPTLALCEILLPDAGRIQEEDAAYANRKSFSRHHPALPLYTEEDATRALDHLVPIEFGESRRLDDLELCIQPAGHILGAGSATLTHEGRSLLLSGDLGREDAPLMRGPTPPDSPSWVVIESTYGDRAHTKVDPVEEIGRVLTRTLQRDGTLLIPSFAVGRAQTLLYCLHEVFRRGIAPEVPVYINSPMATSVTELYRRYHEYHRLPPELCEEVCGMAHFVRSVDDSRELSSRGRFPGVIISASGMATAGRVLHHLKSLAPDTRNTILLPGFQAMGTRGDALARGASTVKIHGGHVPVRAEVVQFDHLSAHADQAGLLAWIAGCSRRPRRTFVTHGDPLASDALRRRIEETLGFRVEIPEYRDEVTLD